MAKDDAKRRKWSFGRPVFKKVDGEPRFLFVSRFGTWMIADSVTSNFILHTFHITSGRGANSPTSALAGGSEKLGVNSWRFSYGNHKWTESNGDIDLKCKERADSRKRQEVGSNEKGEWVEGVSISVTSP